MREIQINVRIPDGDLLRLELFKDETITLTQTIQNARDIGSIFTDFTQSFTLPASKTNNKIFKFYYNVDIDGGFNANDKLEAQILLNSILFRKGYLALNSVELKNNKPHSYKVTFFGETVDIKKQLKDLDLRSLYEGYTSLNHTYDVPTVATGFAGGLFGGNIIYPFISHTERYYFDSGTHAAQSRNLHYVSGGGTSHNQGVNFRDLKPAIKFQHIIGRINATTSLTFDNDGFLDSDNGDYTQLYLWLSRERGALGQSYTGGEKFILNVDSITNWFADGGTGGGFVVDSNGEFESIPLSHLLIDIEGGIMTVNPRWGGTQTRDYDVTVYFEVTPAVSSSYDIFIIDTLSNTTVASRQGVTGTQLLSYRMTSVGNPTRAFQFRIETEDNTFSISSQYIRLKYRYYNGNRVLKAKYSRSNTLTPTGLVNDIDVALQMPSIKVLDLLTGFFKMFNLTAYYQEDGTIKVDTLDDYYSGGATRDISQYVDVEKSSVNYPIPYQEIAFRYKEPKTFLAINFKEINGYQFGNLENTTVQESDVQRTDRGNKYVVQLPYEHVIYEKLIDLNNALSSVNLLYGWSVDKDRNPVAVEPLIFYRRQTYAPWGYSFQDLGGSGTAAQRYTYNRASNSYFQKTLNYGAEVDEYTGIVKPDSLFANYYNTYVSELFNQQRRLIKVTAQLPLSFLLEYSLKDTLVINGRHYNINSIKTNLQTGKSELELYNKLNLD